jgi:WD40 repeat protein
MSTTMAIAMANVMVVVMNFRNYCDVCGVTIHPPLPPALLAGSYDRFVRLWDVSTRCEVATMHLSNSVSSVAFDKTGKYLAAGGARGVTCDGDVYADNDSDCDGECDDGGDGCREHCDVCACDHPPLPLLCSSSQALKTPWHCVT